MFQAQMLGKVMILNQRTKPDTKFQKVSHEKKYYTYNLTYLYIFLLIMSY